MADAQRLWTALSKALRDQVSEAIWKTWFEGVSPVAFTGDRVILAVPNNLVKERLEGRYLALLQDAVDSLEGEGGRTIELLVQTEDRSFSDGELAGLDLGVAAGEAGQPPAPAALAPAGPGDRRSEDVPINPRYVFDTFVIGTSNRFSHAAALSVAESPGRSYNPLFIHGEAGLGKTHLLHAIGNYVRANFPGRHVRYVSTETFMNEFIDGIRTNATSQFKRRYRDSDVLLVDDVQFLEHKEATQEEFFHTFNTIYGSGGQIVITSDRHPKALETLAERLRSRFLSGLITDVQPPEFETRLAILHKKAGFDGTIIHEDALEFIATHVKHNIRELEGALLRVSAFASLNREAASLELAERVLADIVSAGEPRPITPEAILQATAETFGFTVEELRGPSRRRPLVTARQIGMYVFREMTDFSYPAIAREFGGRDHTTVIHAFDKISGLMGERRQIYDQVTQLMTRIKKGAT